MFILQLVKDYTRKRKRFSYYEIILAQYKEKKKYFGCTL